MPIGVSRCCGAAVRLCGCAAVRLCGCAELARELDSFQLNWKAYGGSVTADHAGAVQRLERRIALCLPDRGERITYEQLIDLDYGHVAKSGQDMMLERTEPATAKHTVYIIFCAVLELHWNA